MVQAKSAVIAIGGNSLIKDKQHQTVKDQHQAVKETCVHIADMIAEGWEVVISHGNGPQVGFILRRSEIAARVANMHEVPLDVCVADTQGALGYALQQNLHNQLGRRGIRKVVATVITQVRVDGDDPAFETPSKPIGGFMDAEEARRRADTRGWVVVEDAGRGWRRVVASPDPQEIIELAAVKQLLASGIITIAVGGGGIPVVRSATGDLRGVPAVIDKDLASSLLAQSIRADLFLISTAVEHVYLNFHQPNQRSIDVMTTSEARRYLREGHFAKGSMDPKVRSILRYMEAGGRLAIITDPSHITAALHGEAGTRVVAD